MKLNDMIEVMCPICGQKRAIKWSAYKNKDIGPPYLQKDRTCSQKTKKLTEETKNKISNSLKGVPKSDAMIKALSEYRKAHPSDNLIPGQGGGWNKGLQTGERSEETKKKISDSMKKETDDESD